MAPNFGLTVMLSMHSPHLFTIQAPTAESPSQRACACNAGALVARTGFWSPLYCTDNKVVTLIGPFF